MSRSVAMICYGDGKNEPEVPKWARGGMRFMGRRVRLVILKGSYVHSKGVL